MDRCAGDWKGMVAVAAVAVQAVVAVYSQPESCNPVRTGSAPPDGLLLSYGPARPKVSTWRVLITFREAQNLNVEEDFNHVIFMVSS
jgi:hypothetical protein